MILFITKKATNIYKAVISFLILQLSTSLYAVEELASFCFTPAVNVEDARDSLSFLLLPREKVFLRPDQRCMDVLTSADRVKLLEKFLRLRYTLVVDEDKKAEDLEQQHCLLELKKTSNRISDTTNVRLGTETGISAGTLNSKVNETSELLLGLGKPGALAIDKQVMWVECRKGATGVYQLSFSLTESGANRLTTEVSAKKNEVINIGQINRDLNERSRVLGVPQTAVNTAVGTEETLYQLQVKN